MKFKDSSVLITGGASGIGKIMGRMALEKGAAFLIIRDINPQNIRSTEEELGKYGTVKGYIVDVSKNSNVTECYEKVKAIEKDKTFMGIPFGFHFIRFWQAILPTRIFDWLFGEVFGIYHTMDGFTGRKAA